MATAKNKQWWKSGAGLLALAVILLAGVVLIRQLPPWRIDFTEDSLFTVSDGTRGVLSDLSEPVELEFFFSDSVSAEYPQLRDYARRINELLTEYEIASGGNLTVSVIDPEPFSEAEDRATEAGLQGVPANPGGDNIYFGLVGNNASGDERVIEFFSPSRENFLEYDISQLVYRLANPNPLVVGILTSLPVFGGFDFVSRNRSEAWLIIQQLKQLGQVRQLSPTLEFIEDDVDVLMLIHPPELPTLTQYQIDQFVLNGGKLLAFVDPHSDVPTSASPTSSARSSDLPTLLKAWGVAFDPTRILGDAQWAMRLPAGEQRTPLPHLAIMGMGEESLNREDIITAELETLNLAIAGFIEPADDATTTMRPLVMSSELAMPLEAERFIGLTNHGNLLNDFDPTGERYTVAARIQGNVQSAFPEGVPQPENDAARNGGDGSAPAEEDSPEQAGHLAQGDINVIVVADSDLLTDRLWVQVNDFFGQRVAAPWANNGDLVSNAVENMAGSSDLINIRSRGSFSRPFHVVAELEMAAAERFRAQEKVLTDRLAELEQRIQQLSRNEKGQVVLELNREQQEEIQAFEEQRLAIRKELRQVQHQLNKDIESLETQLKLVNIALVPGILTLVVMALAWMRARRRGRHGES